MVTKSDEYTKRAYKLLKGKEELKYLLDYDFDFVVMNSDKEKKTKGKIVYGDCRKVDEYYKEFCPYDFMITIYDKNCEELTEDQFDILLIHEMMHMDIDDSNGDPKYSILSHDVEDFRKIIDLYGIDWAKAGE